jgi:hypothetical protein
MLIRRADQSRWRLVIDYRVLNKQTEEFKIVLPSIDDIYSSLRSAEYLPTKDIQDGFHSLEIDAEDE